MPKAEAKDECAGLPEIARSIVFMEGQRDSGTLISADLRLRGTYLIGRGYYSGQAVSVAKERLRRQILGHLYRDRYRETAEAMRKLSLMEPYGLEWREAQGRLVRLAEHACEPWPLEVTEEQLNEMEAKRYAQG